MHKKYKILFVFFLLFSFHNTVYAANQCTYMPGKNNDVIIPKGYFVDLIYQYDRSNSSIKLDIGDEPSIHVQFYGAENSDQTLISIGDGEDTRMHQPVISFDASFNPTLHQKDASAGGNAFTWHAFQLIENIGTFFDEQIKNEPKSIYFVEDQGNKYIGFSSKESPDLSLRDSDNAKYIVFKINMKSYQTMFYPINSNDEDLISLTYGYNMKHFNQTTEEYFDDEDLKYYQEEIAKCGDSINRFIVGPGNYTPPSGEHISEIKTFQCSYTFALHDGKDCTDEHLDLTFSIKSKYGESTLSVNKNSSVIELGELGNSIIWYNHWMKYNQKDKAYEALKGFLQYENGTWTCGEQVFVNDGTSKYILYPGGMGQVIANQYPKSHIYMNGPTCLDLGYNSNPNKPGWNGDKVDNDCEGILGEALLNDIKTVLLWIRIIVPILLIVLGSVDFVKAILSDDQQELKKSTNRFVKRCIIAVAIFFIPMLIMYIISFIDKVADVSCDIRLW